MCRDHTGQVIAREPEKGGIGQNAIPAALAISRGACPIRPGAHHGNQQRHAIQLAPRWAVQVVAFLDFEAFQTFTDDGKVKSRHGEVNADGACVLCRFFFRTRCREWATTA